MITFLVSVVALIVGYVIYGAIVERVFGADENRKTPALTQQDGVDFVPLDWKKNFLIQLLNIAGLGPVFGAISGALWGPVAFLWIVLGGIFAGAVHDYFSGMISMRHGGASVPEMVGGYLGKGMKYFINFFSVVLLVLVGTVFMTGPAALLAVLTPEALTKSVWVIIILVYYILATMLPIDKVIGRIYPVFAVVLLIMAFGIIGGIFFGGYQIPELTLANLHPKNAPIWPLLFITIACGAISGFHGTQSPLIARCTVNEKLGRRVFYGAMIAESVIALIWAAAAMTFFGGTGGLAEALANGGPGAVVNKISITLLGAVGGTLAVLGVIVLPITSGDTAFRSARLTIADFLGIKQGKIANRFMISIPLFVIGYTLSQLDFTIIWRYFAWSNQTLAMIMLWTAATYLAKNGKFHWITTIPATFMTAVTITYILQAPEGFRLGTQISYPVGMLAAALAMGLFLIRTRAFGAKPEESSASVKA